MDDAGRVMVPKLLRDQLGLRPGPIEIVADGAGLRIKPITGGDLVERDGHLIIPADGYRLTDDEVRALRFVDQP